MSSYINFIDEKVLNQSIFTSILNGFTDSFPLIRESTLKSMVIITPKLTPYNRNSRMLKYLEALQRDPEPVIRTNTVICVCKILPFLDERGQKEVAIPLISNGFNDPSSKAKFHLLKALISIMERFPPELICSAIIPNVARVMLDKSKDVREKAHDVVVRATEIVKVYIIVIIIYFYEIGTI